MQKIEIELIKQAIMKEVRSYEFYKLSAGQAEQEDVKQALMNLSKEEMKHIEWLHDLFDRIKEDALDDYTLAATDAPDTPQLMKWDTIKADNLNLLVSVFGIAMDMEKSAKEFYEEAEARSEVKEAKNLFHILAKWEDGHWAQFAKDYAALQEEWWAEQQFAPF